MNKSKVYSPELINHLGNVLAVVSDKKIPIDDDGLGNQDGMINYYQPDIKQSMDYSPFGVILQDRTKRGCESLIGAPTEKSENIEKYKWDSQKQTIGNKID